MMSKPNIFLCNGASNPNGGRKLTILEYRAEFGNRNIHVGLPTFIQNLFHIPDRTLDLLEIAAYIFSGDRLVSRGKKDAVEYHSWSRSYEYHINVRDSEFWNRDSVKKSLRDVLLFMTGDSEFEFYFYPDHSTPPTGLFDREGFSVDVGTNPIAVTLFSGGLDSLAGSLDLLAETQGKVILVSHQSQSGTTRTQRQLFAALDERYPERLYHYPFDCHLKGRRAPEETQRTRSFLYCSIGYAIATAYDQNEIYVYENGVTSLNFYRREDMVNARASRTTHPQTISRMANFLTLLNKQKFTIRLPYALRTKQEVVLKIKESPYPELISSAVSCGRTFLSLGSATHCGECFQCIDRRIAAYGAEVDNWDNVGLYAQDVISQNIDSPESRTTAIDYIRQAAKLSKWNIGHFESEYLSDLAEIIDFLPEKKTSEYENVELIWKLMQRHGEQVFNAIKKIRDKYDDPRHPLQPRCLLAAVSQREHLKPEVKRSVESISQIVQNAVGEMFRKIPPKDEPDLNAKIGALLRTHDRSIKSEHPTISFACAQVVPDHQLDGKDLLIESKYIRKGTTPSKANEGIASDLTKYPLESHILFLVYDPQRAISNDEEYKQDIERRGRCTVKILR